MKEFSGVANTLFVPLVARIYVSKRFPAYFHDEKALEIEPHLPEGIEKGAFEYTHLASVARYYNMDQTAEVFIQEHPKCNVVLLGGGLETAYDRLTQKLGLRETQYYCIDLPDVIQARERLLGKRPQETCIGADLFAADWSQKMDADLPTLLIAAGVFQYFPAPKILDFIETMKQTYPSGELLFDATNKSGLAFANWFIRRTGNKDSRMHFYINDTLEFAKQSGTKLLEERTFFKDALRMLGEELHWLSRISMKIADKKNRTMILHLRLNG